MPEEVALPVVVEERRAKPAKPAKAKKLSPELAAKARELRDRWSDRQDEFVALPAGKYDVARVLEADTVEPTLPTAGLIAA